MAYYVISRVEILDGFVMSLARDEVCYDSLYFPTRFRTQTAGFDLVSQESE